ncbi:MAG TPA: methylated-DNA--[protein]-cysteine S-methyltransferase [Candidatus Limnocylindria bacterium]|nr:methylated-DNA--[protein]-cysteine S-methyltransferase [Candidatus Limnocylindria bacterium]
MSELEVTLKLRDDLSHEAASAAARFVEAAAESGALDVAYASVDSPFGRLLVAASTRGLLRLAYPDEPVDALMAELAEEVSPRILEAPGRLDPLRRQLDEYFAGSRRRFEFPIDWRLVHGFGRDVLRVTADIPYGKVSTYGEVAVRTGRPKASRAVGNALGANPMPIVIPCHRVVRTGGGLGGYTGGVQRKERLLQLEGGAPR